MNRAGQYVTVLYGEAAYKAYRPNPLPPVPELATDGELAGLLAAAHRELGKLDATSALIPDIDLFLGAYVRKEALLSSQIEGTQATIEDVLDADAPDTADLDVCDVINYVRALNLAIEEMKTVPLCSRLLCDTHRELMRGVRGGDKCPGEFRRSQNWIGAAGSTIRTARYIPPAVEDMTVAMSDLEKFINLSDMDGLLKTALAHYQFETIHPFLDGNGRIGRMLITLMLMNERLLTRPVLYLSLFLKTNRVEYYDRLSEVRVKGNYEQWVEFFLSGVAETCADCTDAVLKMNALLTDDAKKIEGEAPSVKKVFAYIKSHPIVSIGGTAKAAGLSFNAVSAAVNKLCSLGIMRERTTSARNRAFEYTAYLDILRLGT